MAAYAFPHVITDIKKRYTLSMSSENGKFSEMWSKVRHGCIYFIPAYTLIYRTTPFYFHKEQPLRE
jgi:hypothetical protein